MLDFPLVLLKINPRDSLFFPYFFSQYFLFYSRKNVDQKVKIVQRRSKLEIGTDENKLLQRNNCQRLYFVIRKLWKVILKTLFS